MKQSSPNVGSFVRRKRRIGNHSARLLVEVLEDRTLLTTFTVNSTGTGDTGTGDAGTLLYAVDQLNSVGGASNIINFNISGSGVQTISPTAALPTIIKPVTIEGTASSGVPQIQILGASAGSTASGLTFGSGSLGSSVQELVIAGFGDYGIYISSSSSTGDSVLGCWLGINASGSAEGNEYGIYVAASGATIGGTASGACNVISGNTKNGVYIDSSSCLVEGNDIGTNAAGTAVPNADYGIDVVASGATIGGAAAGAGNIISGNSENGIYIDASCLVEGNDIGTNGTIAVPNAAYGIDVVASGATIGGTAALAGNVISGNTQDGVLIDASSCLVEGNDIGTNAGGTAAVANVDYGIYVETSGATIGGTATGAGNTISGNTEDGVYIDASCLVEGNDIGTNEAGAAVPNSDQGIHVVASGATIGGTAAGAGNIISGNTENGISINASSCLVEGNDIGTNGTDSEAVANGYSGIYATASGATIGGTTATAANVISGNTEYGVEIDASCLVEGNDIGTNPAGATTMPNVDYGIYVIASGATIGGTATGAANVISGNNEDGVYIDASCLIEGNDIGTIGSGTATVPNGAGIYVGASGATVGGTTTGAANVISGNDGDGIDIYASCLVEGNDIGTNAAGTALANGGDGIYVRSSGASIGGTATGTGNVISGNSGDGVYIGASCLVEGNHIGTNAGGTAAVPNQVGIYITGSAATIGATSSGAGNTISDNSQAGIDVTFGATATITDDAITGDGTGILVGSGASDSCVVTAQDDNLSGNTTAGITSNQTNPAYFVTAIDDWWGSLHGPTSTANPGGNGTSVSSNVSFTPWIGVYTTGSGPGFQPTGITLYAVPTQLVFVTEPSSTAQPGVAFATQPIVKAEDASGNLGINFDATTVPGVQAVMTLNTAYGTGTLAGTTSVSPSGGSASFSGLNITAMGAYTLTVSAPGFGSLSLNANSSQINLDYYSVTSTGTGNVAGTLLNAINQLNSAGGSSNLINFNISGSGVQTISPTAALPAITKPITIKGTAIGGVPQIQILGGSAGSSASGLTFGSGSSGSSVQDLVIAGFGDYGVYISSSSSTGDSVLGCWLGINASGSADGNEYGIYVAASGATIGGTATGAGNVISGNTKYGVYIDASSCLVEGNDIGTNAAGTAVPNVDYGIDVVASGATIGGTATLAGNVISGNSENGIYIDASCLVEGNDIGTNGAVAVPNVDYGIDVVAAGATIGGTAALAGNVISGNTQDGVLIDASSCLVVGNDIGTNAGGTAAVPNVDYGIYVETSGATIGGTASGAGNTISGNTEDGAYIDASCLVEGNDIGTNAAGATTIPNVDYGIDVAAGTATIGGTTTGAGNTISDNSLAGIAVTSGAKATLTDDAITSDGTGILVGSGAGDTCLVTAQDDNLSGNSTAGITNNQTNASYVVTATDNWWGSLNGPTTTANPGGNGAGVSSNVSFTPWIGLYTPGDGTGFQPTGITLYAVPTQLVFVTEPSSMAQPGAAFATQPVVEAEDVSGNLGINFDAATVPGVQAVMTLNTIDGVGTLAGTTSVSPSGGFATFSRLNITVSGFYTLTATASGFGSLSVSGTSSEIQNGPPTYTVTSTGTGNVVGTLLYAINQLNSTGGSSNLINFDIPGSGVQSITLTAQLPTITKPVTIEGTAIGGVPQIQILGGSLGTVANASGLTFGSGSSGSSVQDLVIAGFGGDGIYISSTSSTGDSVLGCWLGINASGSADGNDYGIEVYASGATIGGTTTGARNIISGNNLGAIWIGASSCLVEGNYIGTNAAGTAAVANSDYNASDNYAIGVGVSGATIGGTATGAGNVISGNAHEGIYIDASCLVEGNYIGTNAAGTAAVPNLYPGIYVNASGATIGGTTASAGNIISGNADGGIDIYASCVVEGNDIGTNAAGTAAVANADYGIYVWASGTTIGGTATGAANIISGNNDGIVVEESCLVEGNYIGTNAAGTASVANGDGIVVLGIGSATIGGTTAGAGNTISDNTNAGIDVDSDTTVAITDDSITGDGTGILVGSDSYDTCLVTAQDDNLSGDTTAAITNHLTNPAYAVIATDDWWGSPDGPTTTANPGGNGTSVSSAAVNVSFTPWIGLYTPGAGPGFQPTGVTDYAVPTQFVFVTEPSSAVSPGVAFATQPVVEAEDASGNLGINFDAATVPGVQAMMTLNDLLGTGTLAGTTLVSPSGGFASFSGLNINGGGTFSLTVAASGFGSLGVSGTSSEIQNVPPTYTVTSTGTGDVSGTLPWAIDQVNSSAASSNIIDFNIGSGVQTINLTSQLPTITKPVTIEGTAIAGVPQIQILGGSAGSTASGLTFAAGSLGSSVQDLVIAGFGDYGIDITSTGVSVLGCWLGFNAFGSADGNDDGVFVGGANATIGGTTASAANIISGNTADGIDIYAPCLVEGNDIGTNAAGTAVVANDGDSIYVDASSATIGGTTAASANVISGNFSGSSSGIVQLGDLDAFNLTLDITGGGAAWTTNGSTLTGALTNAGSVAVDSGVTLYQGGTSSGTSIINQAGATFDLQGCATLSSDPINPSTFTNAGTLEKSTGGGTATMEYTLTNATGTVQVLSATLSIPTSSASGGTLSGGNWIVGASSTLTLDATISTLAASVVLDGPGAAFSGLTSLTSISGTGVLELENGAGLTTSSSVVNAGAVDLGAGTLDVTGSFTQTPTGTYEVGIGGLVAGSSYGQLNVTNSAALNGTLSVTLISGYVPPAGNSYQVLTFASATGNFSSELGLYFGGGESFTSTFSPSTNPTALELVVASENAGTQTSVQSSDDPSNYGSSVTFTATVSPNMPTELIPTGQVAFYDGSTEIGSGTLESGSASYSTTSLVIGSHSIVAQYTGDSNFSGSNSPAITQSIDMAASQTSLQSSKNPSAYGDLVTFTVAVSPSISESGLAAPTGQVDLYDGTTLLATETLSGGTATYSTTSLTGGAHSIVAQYMSDSIFSGSNSPTITQTVDVIASQTSLQSSENPSTHGDSVTFTATVSPSMSGSGFATPTGQVNFFNGSTLVAAETLSGGTASYTTSALADGANQPIEAQYQGDNNYDPSHFTIQQTVNASPPAGFNVAAGTNFTVPDGNYAGGTTFNVGAGASVTIDAGTFSGGVIFNLGTGAVVSIIDSPTFSGTLTGSGGEVQIESGRLYVGTGGLTLNFPGSIFQWIGGQMDLGEGNLTNLGTLTITAPVDFYNDGILYNYGSIIQTGSGNLQLGTDGTFPSTLVNEAGALYLLEGSGGLTEISDSGSAPGQTSLSNDGIIRKTAGTGTSDLSVLGSITNTGTIEADSGAISLSAVLGIAQVAGNTLTGGTWNALDGASLYFPGGTAITSNEANLTLGGAGASIIGIAGLASNRGTFDVTNGANFTTSGGFTNSGSLTVGPGSILTISGNFTQTSNGTLSAQIGGTPVSGLFGQVDVKGTAALAGSFNVALVNGFSPSSGQTFDLMSFASATGSFTSITGLNPFFTESLGSTGLNIEDAATQAVDLAATSVTAPITSDAGQSITVNWQATDQSSQATTGSWQDSVYTSATPTITSSSTLLGMVPENITLDGGSSYNATLTATLPAALAPGYYYVIVEVDSLYQLPDPNRANNTLIATTGQIDIGLPTLTLGTAYSDSFTAADQNHYYQISVPAGGSLNVSLLSSAPSGDTALYISQGTVPTPYNYEQEAVTANEPDQTAVVPQVFTAGTYYILAHSVSGAAATAGFTITVTQAAAVSVSAISSYAGGNAGNVTVEIDGDNFTPAATASLSLGGTTIDDSTMDFVSASQMFATFNLAGAAVGSYTLSVRQGVQTVTAPSTFQVVAANPASLNVVLITPQYIRSGRTGTVVVTYTNETHNDIVAPLLGVSSTNTGAYFSTPDNPNNYIQSAQILAVAPTGPAGILRPGESGQLTLTLLDDNGVGNEIPVQVKQIELGQTINWAADESALEPPGVPAAAWSVIYGNLLGVIGSTTNSYNGALAQAATYLSALGQTTAQVSDVGTLWSFLVSQADAEYPSPTLTSAVDATLQIPGSFSLSIDRTFASSIEGRSTPGIFGLGWQSSWQTTLSVDSSGNVSINGSLMGYFVLQPGGTYLDTDGTEGTLTKSDGMYTFANSSGDQYVFLPNGDLNFEQDLNGNRITLGYNAQNQLVTLTYSNPSDPSEPTEQLTLTYNSQGFVSQVADGTGDVWNYSYDAAGHLLSVTAPGPTSTGLTTTYTYGTSNDPETVNALLSITSPVGSQQNFTYSATTGQLTSTSANGGTDAVTYTYPGEAEVQATDSAGDETTTWYNNWGEPSRVESPLGEISTYLYDDNGNLVSYTDAAGNTYQYTYNSNGDKTEIVNPLGQTVNMTYNSLSDLTSITDADGNTTQYSYGSTGNLLSITYPDGTQQSFSYDPLGDLSETIEQNGDPVGYQYNAQGLLAQESFADGSYETFGYDAHGNMLTAQTYGSDGTLTGTTTMTYNGANELTSVSYPGGLSLTFTYNAEGQRTQSVDQSGYTIDYSYDSLGRLAELTDGSANLIVQYTYNALGELTEKLNGNGTCTTYAYDADGNLASEINYAGGTTVNSSFTYTYNVLNEMTSMTDASGNVTTYGYDAIGELTQVTLPGEGTIAYVYNSAGDRTEVINNGTATSYSSNDDNEVTQVGSTSYTYDANGNLARVTDASGTTTYTYNDLNQLVSISDSDGTVTDFQYSPLGFLVGETVNGVQTNYLVDPTGLVNTVGAYTGSGSLIADYTYGLGLVSQIGPSGTGYYDFDASGNTVGITGANGSYVNQYSYLPFGETTTISATVPNPFQFGGQYGVMTVAAGLDFMRARYYSQSIGSFLSQDPVGLFGGDLNLYRYSGNSSPNAVDPTGTSPISIITAARNDFNAYQTAKSGYELSKGDLSGQTCEATVKYITGETVEAAVGAAFELGGLLLGGVFGGEIGLAVGRLVGSVAGAYVNDYLNLGGAAANIICPPTPPTPPPPPSTPPPSAPGPSFCIIVNPVDPNALVGPSGYGNQGFIQASGTLPYTIDFENDGTAAAQDVTVTEQLDSNLDWSTFQLGSFGFGTVNVTIPAGLTQYETIVSYENSDGSSLNVEVSLDFNVSTGLLTVNFVSLDPLTGEAPTGVFDGFLYPESESPIGSDGYVQYTIALNAGLATGTTINQQASVVFDTNAPLDTLVVTNTIDAGPPTSSVAALPPEETSTSFTVTWSGQDNPSGSGIAYFNVYVSDDGGPYSLWQSETTATSATFTGILGDAYSFYSVATDNVGNVEATPTSAQATTTVTSSPTVIASQPPPGVLAGSGFGLAVDELNAQNQIDTSYNGCVTVSLASNPGNSMLGGTTTVQAVNGVATFSDLTISNPGLAYTLQVSATGASSITSAPFDVAAYQLVASGASQNFVWYGTSGSDQVQFTQTAAGTVQITASELGGLAFSFTGTVTGVTGYVVVNEYDVAGDADVVDGSGLATIPSDITVGNGNDTVIGGGGANTIVAGDGDNTIYGNGIGISPNTSLKIQDPSNTITVGDGNNIIFGNYSGTGYQGGDNTITAGNGDNTIYGNYVNGGYTDDTPYGVLVDGAEGSDNTISVGNGDNTIYGNYGSADGGEGGSNTIVAGNGNDIIYGNAAGNDTQRKQGSNFIQVGNGNDTIYGNLGGDGGEGGNNTILTGSGTDTIYGNFGGDGGEGGNNLIVAGGGNDTIYAHCGVAESSTTSGTTAKGQDLIIGGTGADTVYGWPAGYTLGSNTGDLFIAGTTNLSLSALDSVLAEWDSTDSYATRVADLSGQNGSVGANGSDFLISGTTVFGSAAVDQVFGTVGSDDDWYLVTNNDQLNNVNPNEVTLISVYPDQTSRVGGAVQIVPQSTVTNIALGTLSTAITSPSSSQSVRPNTITGAGQSG